MKLKILFLFIIFAGLIAGCDTEQEALIIQKPYTFDDQYYANLRAYKESDHQVFFGWYAAYAHREGVVADYKQSASFGEHIAGIPDSVDIVSLWMGIPSPDPESDSYNPIAVEEIRFAREVKGTKFIMPHITRIEDYDFTLDSAGIIAYADYLLEQVFRYDFIDGLDLDYEPEGDWIGGDGNTRFLTMVEYIGQFLGPKSENPEMLLVIDYWSQAPHPDTEPYINYLVRQAYTQGVTVSSADRMQNFYNQVTWCPPEKFIVTENMGDWWENAGAPFTEADGNTLRPDGTQLYSLEGMARWNPVQGQKAGFGAFYFDRDYQNYPPYGNIRRAIQAANPAVQ